MMFIRTFTIILTLLTNALLGSGPTVGIKAIDFTLRNSLGKKVSLSAQKGKVVLLDFWASWCAPCKEEMPFLDMLLTNYGKKGFTILAVNIDNNQNNALKFLNEYNIKLSPLLDANKRVVSMYDVDKMPTSYIIDKEGWIRYIHSGFKSEDFYKYKTEIEALLNERPNKYPGKVRKFRSKQ